MTASYSIKDGFNWILDYIQTLTNPTCKGMWLEGSKAWEQVEDGHLDQRVLTGFVFQHPPTHLDKSHNERLCQL